MTDTNIDEFRIGGDMKEGEGVLERSSVANHDEGSFVNKEEHLGSNGDYGCDSSRGGGNSPKEGTANSSRVTKKSSKKKKNTCYFSKCNNPASKFIGDCNFCKGHYCSKHRLMENHACEGLTSCKEDMHKRNADKLAAEQTRVPKIQI
ncbi:hypothetical protein HG535_0F05520 [Zygotorulaspora mrakii]|uniref:AN1-type domain-containing protein n=1 Tax=Zygotorulaspora mrakii TaxID=42260 RepID=A0A7H9B676_ZYGMR|nr:uncharacterized protein HG535_0F05520 [Zygotorulaspora mrakii]QLG74040.1 hypothetical protein HG535_0F05520 [Zygotorulaspora mrakii]